MTFLTICERHRDDSENDHLKEKRMAKFWENLEYHEDTIKKHKITEDEIAFLKALQKEMNTQDNFGQANPRYWVIRDFEEVCGQDLNNPDGYILYCVDDFEEVCRFQSTVFGELCIEKVVEFFIENYSEDFEKRDFETLYDLDSLNELLEEKGYENSFGIVEYEIYPKYSGFFLTHKAAETHLKENAHHYSENATTYAMTAWRNQEEDMLFKILQQVDFEMIN